MQARRFLLVFFLLLLIKLPAAGALPLWEIQGTDNRIRLLGSVHFLRQQDFPLPPEIMDAYHDADVIVMELDLDALDPMETLEIMQRLSIDPRGRNLESLLGARDYEQAHELAAGLGIDLAAFMPYEPWFAALQITQLRLMQLGFDGSFGVDAYLSRQAVQDGKEIRGLETLEVQLDSMDSLPPKAQSEFLQQTLEDAADVEEIMVGVVKAWKAGDTSTLQTDLMDGLDEQPELYERLLVQRNNNWAASILELTDDSQDYLIVVGTLHLVGDDSLLRLIEDAGYPTRQLK
jgi:uncharacterized protein YbaP (TraB family)